jgi:HNH endonuclease
MSTLTTLRLKIYKTVARQLHGQVPCWVCGQHVPTDMATLEHIVPRSQGGNSHQENLAISHAQCNLQRHAKERSVIVPGPMAELEAGPFAKP